MNKQVNLGVFIGRFHPFHVGHEHVVRRALEVCDNLMIVVGSANMPRGLSNMFTEDERKEMIEACLSDSERSRVHIVSLEDSINGNSEWVSNVEAFASSMVSRLYSDKSDVKVSLIGHEKDASSYYLKLFPRWERIEVEAFDMEGCVLSATQIREKLVGSISFWNQHLENASSKLKANEFTANAPEIMRGIAMSWLDSRPQELSDAVIGYLRHYVQSDKFDIPCKEAAYVAHFRYPWRHSPYQPIFVTADPVVFHKGQVLMIKRADHPGRGQWALPGGFVEADEYIYEGSLRELSEETKLGLSEEELHEMRFHHHCYEDPKRSIRGRVITHTFGFQIPDSFERPSSEINDESLALAWVKVEDLKRNECFEDHYKIVQHYYAIINNNK